MPKYDEKPPPKPKTPQPRTPPPQRPGQQPPQRGQHLGQQPPQPRTPPPQPPYKPQEQKQKVKSGLTKFFGSPTFKLITWSTKTFAPALMGAALFPFFGPVGSIAAAMGVAAVVHSIQDQLGPSGLHLQEDTLNKLVEPLQGKQFDEAELREVIGKVLPDRQANEDLKQFFIKLLPTIREAKPTTINISGPVQGLIAGDNNTIEQTFHSFLPKEDTV